MTLVFFSFFYSISATAFSKFFWGAGIKSIHAIFLASLCSGCAFFAIVGYERVFNAISAVVLNIIFVGSYMLGPLYGGMNLDVPIKKAGWIFFAMLTFFVLIIFYWAFSDFSGFWSINNIWLYSIIMAMLYLYFFFVVLQLPSGAEN